MKTPRGGMTLIWTAEAMRWPVAVGCAWLIGVMLGYITP
jgi:hypothetical protein